MKPINQIPSPFVAFFTGPVGSGKDSVIEKLVAILPSEDTLSLLMTPVVDMLCTSNELYAEMRKRGERLPAHDIAVGYKSYLLRATRDPSIRRIFSGGACRHPKEAQIYFDMLINRRQEFDVHYFSFKCPRHTCIERDHARAKNDMALSKPPRVDWGVETAGNRWDDHVDVEPHVLSVVSQYPKIRVHEIDATEPKDKVLRTVWNLLGLDVVMAFPAN